MVATASIVGLAGCGERIDPPDAEAGDAVPTVVSAPADPADDPQLDALDLPEQRSGVPAARPIEDEIERLGRLSMFAAALERRLGDPQLSSVATSTGFAARIPADDGIDEWRSAEGHDARRFPLDERAPASATTIALSDVDFAAPAGLAAGIARRAPGASLSDVTLGDASPWGMVWRLRVARGSSSLTVTAAPDGRVLAVSP